jgi:hypothetical protein
MGHWSPISVLVESVGLKTRLIMEAYYNLAAGIFLAIVATLLALVVRGLSRALKQQQQTSRLPLLVGLWVLGWLCVLAFLALTGFFSHFDTLPPRLVFALLPPLLITLFLAGSGRLTPWLKTFPLSWLVGAQVFRVAMELVLWLLYRDNRVPVQMTFEGLNFDILVGLTAPLVALYLSRNPSRRVVGVVWNLLGLALLINIVTIAMLSAPTPLRVFMNEPANTIIAQWPFIWLPGFVVPMAFLFHLFSLKQLLAGTKAPATTSSEKPIVI